MDTGKVEVVALHGETVGDSFFTSPAPAGGVYTLVYAPGDRVPPVWVNEAQIAGTGGSRFIMGVHTGEPNAGDAGGG